MFDLTRLRGSELIAMIDMINDKLKELEKEEHQLREDLIYFSTELMKRSADQQFE